jgi:hypothetical protein
MARMIGRGSLGGIVTHGSDKERRNRDDRRQWRAERKAAKRQAKAREKRTWQPGADHIIDFD